VCFQVLSPTIFSFITKRYNVVLSLNAKEDQIFFYGKDQDQVMAAAADIKQFAFEVHEEHERIHTQEQFVFAPKI
tara:strand:+ start:2394 stop:2618 length:225 start_codon:yes stop_codon:yes gene_type:complete